MMQAISIHGLEFILHPTKTIYWPKEEMLLVADVHLGKVAHFRKHGSAVPSDALQQNFRQLQEAIEAFDPKIVCFLGDLFHSDQNQEWLAFEHWVNSISARVVLIVGNHDVIPLKHYENLGIQVVEEWVIDNFRLTHHPEDQAPYFNICGHIHPAVFLSGAGRQKLKLPCFFQQKQQLILPAFGVFTGTYVLTPTKTDQVYVVGEGEVVKV